MIRTMKPAEDQRSEVTLTSITGSPIHSAALYFILIFLLTCQINSSTQQIKTINRSWPITTSQTNSAGAFWVETTKRNRTGRTYSCKPEAATWTGSYVEQLNRDTNVGLQELGLSSDTVSLVSPKSGLQRW